MLTPEHFPPTIFMGAHTEQGGRIASILKVTPQFHRQPNHDWGVLYRLECEQSPVIDWCDAGFAKCKAGEQAPVIVALEAAAAAADARYIDYLRRLAPEEAAKIVEAEIDNKESVGASGPFMLLTY
ncbi:MAG: hypothetical protein EKK51_26985 [Mycolicibacterium sp.]|nr:hypothetical protein [Mycolicibacterium sp.]RUP27436.1 MAG: hypothetical protein EKK51_26985 [Mycolicibacterium sp.]